MRLMASRPDWREKAGLHPVVEILRKNRLLWLCKSGCGFTHFDIGTPAFVEFSAKGLVVEAGIKTQGSNPRIEPNMRGAFARSFGFDPSNEQGANPTVLESWKNSNFAQAQAGVFWILKK